MESILEVFKVILSQYGITAAILTLVILVIGYIVYIINKNYSDSIKKYLENKAAIKDKIHTDAANHRKIVTPQIRKELKHLAEETHADRTLLFEFSNGSSNLVGLPFLYLTATCEILTPTTESVSQKYQKLNTTLFATFLEKLEDKGYYYCHDIEDIKEVEPMLYFFMKPNKVKSMLFYSLYGVEETIGFIVITSTDTKEFTREDTLSKVACTAQLVSSMLNFDKIKESKKYE